MDIEKVKNIVRECIEAVSSGVPNCRLITEMLGQVLEELKKRNNCKRRTRINYT